MKKHLLMFAALLLLTLTLAASASSQSGDIVSNGHAWRCTGAVDLNSVTVTDAANDPSFDSVMLDAGCTGYIGSITVVTYHGDGIKVGSAHDLEVGSINVKCYAHDAGKHQDGIQVMGGNNVRFDSGYVGCYSANDSQSMIHEGAGGQQLPTNVIINGVAFDPQGAGAYGVSNGASLDSGYTNIHLVSLANRHDFYQGTAAQNPVWSICSPAPAGFRANFDTSGDFVTCATATAG